MFHIFAFSPKKPTVLTEAMRTGGERAKRAFEAMMPMKKIDVATIEKAVRGALDAGRLKGTETLAVNRCRA